VVESLESNLESVERAEEIAVALATRAGFDEDAQMQIGISVRESVVNAVAHGNRYNADKRVHFAVTNNGNSLTITVGDEGEGFDANSLPDPLAPENLMRTSGRGIFLIRSFMDDVRIRRREPAGMEVTLVKYVVYK
jgi:serine/threonine-protein kinase RsbW